MRQQMTGDQSDGDMPPILVNLQPMEKQTNIALSINKLLPLVIICIGYD